MPRQKRRGNDIGRVNTTMGALVSLVLGIISLIWSMKLFDLGTLSFIDAAKVYFVAVGVTAGIYYILDYFASRVGYDL